MSNGTSTGRQAGERRDALRLLVLIPDQPDGNGMPFARRQSISLEQRFGVKVTRFFLRDRMHPVRLWQARRELRALLRRERPQVVHVHYGSMAAFFTVMSTNLPVVITFHGSDLNPTPTDGRLRDFFGRLLSQLAVLRAAAVICVSEGLFKRLWWRRSVARVMPLGVDLELFRPLDRETCRRELGWTGPERVLLFNANNPALKRLDIAQAVVQQLNAQGMSVRLEVLRGGIDPDHMPVLMNGADALLLCSDQEGSPTMVKEAMGCNLPVVSSDVGDVRQRLRDVRPGAVVEQEVDALAKALSEVLRDGRRSNGRELAARNGIDSRKSDEETYGFLCALAK
jgi:teichuronic acid biosynthesis glycosyltransferase TuaC